MKKGMFVLLLGVLLIGPKTLIGQEAKGSWTTGADVVSSYIYRGTKAGAFSIQPTIKYGSGNFSIGAWGSGDLVTGSPEEADLFASYAFKSGFTLGMTDYHYNTSPLFTGKVHAMEANLGFTSGNFTISGNYIFNTASGAIGNDKYVEASYQFKTVKLFAGAGDGWYSNDGTFQGCNFGLTTTKTLKVSETFSIPVTGSVIVNPNREQVYYVIGITI